MNTPKKYVLYGGWFTRSNLVEQVLSECGVDYDLVDIDTAKGEQRSAEFMKINPAGWVPVLVTPNGTKLYETPAINLYLSEKYAPGELAPLHDDQDRGLFLSGLFYIAGMLEPALKRYWFPDRYADGERDANAIRKKALEDAIDYFAVIDQRLGENGPFHLGGRFSLVDLMTAYWSESFTEPDALSHLEHVKQCHELVYDRPKLRPHKSTQRRVIDRLYELRAHGKGVR